MLVADVARLRDLRRNVAVVDDFTAELLEPVGQTRIANRRRAHVDAPPTLAEIERRTDDRDLLHGRG